MLLQELQCELLHVFRDDVIQKPGVRALRKPGHDSVNVKTPLQVAVAILLERTVPDFLLELKRF